MTTIYTAHEAADYLRCSYVYLAQMRQRNVGPEYFKMGRHVKYRLSRLEAWIQARTIRTSPQ